MDKGEERLAGRAYLDEEVLFGDVFGQLELEEAEEPAVVVEDDLVLFGGQRREKDGRVDGQWSGDRRVRMGRWHGLRSEMLVDGGDGHLLLLLLLLLVARGHETRDVQ